MRPLQWWAESAPLGWDRVKVSENLGATSVAPVAPVVTSLCVADSITTRKICKTNTLLNKNFGFLSVLFPITVHI